MPSLPRALCALIIVFFWASWGWAHGVEGAIAPAEGYLLSVRYDDGEPVSYAEARIHAPDAEPAFQTGRTDRNGRLMFYPDVPGRWRVEVKDGMGHQAALEVAVAADTAKAAPAGPADTPMALGRGPAILIGLAIIFGLAGVWYGWRSRRKPDARPT
jgi:nickel transport protein